MSLSLSLSMSMSFSTSSICMYDLHYYECVMHKSLWATSCNAMLTNSFAFLCSCCIFAWLRASAYGTVHKAPKAQTKDCLRRSSNLAELGWIYCVQDCTVSSQNKWWLIMFHAWPCLIPILLLTLSLLSVGRNRAMADLGVGTGHQFFSPGWCRTAHFFCRAPLLLRQSQQPCYWCAFHKDYSKKQ